MHNPSVSRFFRYILYMLSTFLAGGLTACHTDTVYHVYHPVSVNGWSKQDTLVYMLPDSLKEGCYQLEISVRHTEAYPYRDIWIELASEQEKPQQTYTSQTEPKDSLEIPQLEASADSMIWIRDTLHLYLADEKGRWIKGGTIGSLYQFSAPAQWFCLNNKRGKTIRLIHIMKDNPLTGIHDIGIRLFQTREENN